MDTGPALILSPEDNVASVLADVPPGTDVAIRPGPVNTTVRALESIPYGFKIAVTAIGKGASVVKYGES
jgi:hypothetical protein